MNARHSLRKMVGMCTAAVIMLADAVEAASRTLTDPSPARLKGLVQKIVSNIVLDGQLDECSLTFKDLEVISSQFLRILGGIFHQRVDYPGFNFQPVTKRDGEMSPARKNGGPSPKAAAPAAGRNNRREAAREANGRFEAAERKRP